MFGEWQQNDTYRGPATGARNEARLHVLYAVGLFMARCVQTCARVFVVWGGLNGRGGLICSQASIWPLSVCAHVRACVCLCMLDGQYLSIYVCVCVYVDCISLGKLQC